MTRGQKFLLWTIIIIAGLAAAAPRGDVHKPIPSSAIAHVIPPGHVTHNPCGTFGHIVAAILVNTTGYHIYQVTCSDGVTFEVAR